MRKIIFLVVIVIVAMVCVGFAGIYTFTQAVYNERSCDWANIDNIEMRTSSDIPPTIDSNCEFDPATNTKTVVFQLSMENFDIDNFVGTNGYQKYTLPTQMSITDITERELEPEKLSSMQLYFRADDTHDDIYRMLFDAESGKLYVKISYKN